MQKLALLMTAGMLLAAPVFAEVALEPYLYTENFETREECAWASYPQWQDTAYDQYFRANTIVPGDPNISIVQYMPTYTNVDNYVGAMKELDAYLVPGSTITLRYYLKTNLPAEFFTVRLAAGPDGKLDVTFKNPPTNRWEWKTVTYNDVLRENPKVAGKARIKVNGLAVLAKIPKADPSMPIYFGLDDVTYKGAQAVVFRFAEPQMYKLANWKPHIPKKHYVKGETLALRGTWPVQADRVQLTVVSYHDAANIVLNTPLTLSGKDWALPGYKLAWNEGMYLATLTAYKGNEPITDTQFTVYVSPGNIGGHPRLWFNSDTKKQVVDRFNSERFKSVKESTMNSAKSTRERTPVEKVVWDLDQLPDENWLPTLTAWSGTRLGAWRSALHANALAYGVGGDREAGEYCKNLLVKISSMPYVLHPWMIKRGHHIYYPVGEFGIEMALAYDLTYDLMTDNERRVARDGMMRFVVEGCHEGYVVDDLVISNTSNWVSHITCGSLMCQTAMYGDSPDMAPLEPFFTGAIMKNHELIRNTTCRDGEWGEGYGYFSFTMQTLSDAMPALNNVFKIDYSSLLNGAYKGLLWAGRFTEREIYYFGDSSGALRPMTNWAWMLPKYKDPMLGFMYNFSKMTGSKSERPGRVTSLDLLETGLTFEDVLYETFNVPKQDPVEMKLNPVKFFGDVGTTVFKSGWEKDDFVFVMRTGPFVNHQHIDQGTFWLADRGSLFIEERHGSTYYDDPNYQPWYTQPVGHSTILIDGNHQSQRVGDLLWHIDGFDDYAFLGQRLDGSRAAFASGDIGRLYWGKVKSLKRNVLYLKPRTLLMLDTAIPSENDVDVTLLYQTLRLNDIKPGAEVSTIAKDGNTLHIRHLTPQFIKSEAVKTPHYLYTLRNEPALEPEGMLTVTARTAGVPLVMANLLTTTTGGAPSFTAVPGQGCMSGTAEGIPFAFNTRPGNVYTVNGMTTDAVAVAGDAAKPFVAMAKAFKTGSTVVMEATNPVTFETAPEGFTYNTCRDCELTLGAASKPATVTLNGKAVPFTWNAEKSAVVLNITKGDGVVTVK